ncbi:putative kinesin family protein, partial [Saitoella complicata NRRL Y-17804]
TIKVVARFRPQNDIELREGGGPVVEFEGEDTVKLNAAEYAGSFTFDRVFDMQTKQKDIFEYSIRSTVDDILNGYNGTVFAYGQTGSGKTFTMMGADIDSAETKGVIPRITEQIFTSILTSPSHMEYTVKVSYMEIYMEKIRDLLNPQNDNLPIHEEKARGVYVKGLLEVYVSSVGEVYEVMKQGGRARMVAATNMNAESSRSHSIFLITVTQKNLETGSAKSGQLFLVDLAGSEKVGKTGASGQTLEEAKKINKSLSALGMVINALTDGKSTHVPYRDSKLTRILQESLGGNSRTTLIINCSPASYNDAETLSTLRFGMRAKTIKNKAKINAELSPAELKALLAKAKKESVSFNEYINALEGEITVWRSGDTVPKERWVTRENSSQFQPAISTPLKASFADSPTSTPRASTPIVAPVSLDKDEKEEFLRRENELQDQLSEKESLLAQQEAELKAAREELEATRSNSMSAVNSKKDLELRIEEMKISLEKVTYESKEAGITIDSLREQNTELSAELEDVKRSLTELKLRGADADAEAEKERKKLGKMKEMMSSFELNGTDAMSENIDRALRDAMEFAEMEGDDAKRDVLKSKLTEVEVHLNSLQQVARDRAIEVHALIKRKEELEDRLRTLQASHSELLESKVGEAGLSADELRAKVEEAYAREKVSSQEDELRRVMEKKEEENKALKETIEELQKAASTAQAQQNGTATSPSRAQARLEAQLAEFDMMKKSLMRDLQNRCERVVELEISLDEAREQYNNVLRASNNRAQQRKMAFLERNLEQLTNVQRQLVEQNSSLKKEVAIAERKLIARNERIQSLEALLQDAQDKLTIQNHKFETHLSAVRERINASRAEKLSANGAGGFQFGGSRIAKPLRGGGG